MKNLTKIFMAVVAVMLVSCITDTTTEPTVELGKVKTTIDLSFEGVKTHLGDKNGTQYPLLWSAGDQIAVNGIASEPLAEEFDGKAGASFEIESDTELTYPRSIVYPAPAEGETGVTFPAVQAYEAGNIADGVAPLYGYAAEAGDVITLQHLTGVLRFAVKGDATLSSMTVKAATGALAGSYDIDCATGALTAQEGKTSDQITMSFGEGLALGTEEATPLYIAVPAGNYGVIEVTLTATDGKKMAVKTNTDSKPIKAGVVREFKEFIFGENVIEGDVFEIWDIENLKTFAQTAATATWKEAKLMADLDMTGQEWTSVEGFAKIFDGNGKSIKGLSAPLFGTTSAQIKNLTLEDVALVSNDTPIMGALATIVEYTGETAPKIENCSASGTLTIHNENYILKESDASGELAYAGLIGLAYGTTITGCTSNVDITATQLSSLSNDATSVTRTYIAGIVGMMFAVNDTLSTASDCTNNGAIVVCDKTASDEHLLRLYTGGVIGSVSDGNDGTTLSNLTNNGAISISSTLSSGNSYIGGVAGVMDTGSSGTVAITINNIRNNGDITLTSAKAYSLLIAGMCPYMVGVQSTEIHNYGAINIGTEALPLNITHSLQVGGISYRITDSKVDASVQTASNNAPITVWGNSESLNAMTVAGLFGWSQGVLNNITNSAEGDITVNGSYKITNNSETSYVIGGLVGYKTSGAGYVCENRGDVTVNATYTSDIVDKEKSQYLYVGGFAGRSHQYLQGENYGKTTVTGSTAGATRTYLYVGGNMGYAENGKKTMKNHGEINVQGGPYSNIRIGGTIGYADGGDYGALYNYGKLNVSAILNSSPAIGGLIGYFANGKELKDSTNEGNIDFTGTVGDAADLFFGGVVGRNYVKLINVCNGALGADGKGDATKGKITVTPTVTTDIAGITSTMQLGGCVGDNKGTIDGMKNYGDIYVNGNIHTINIGGCVNYCSAQVSNAYNYGNITVDEDTVTGANIQIGGIMRFTSKKLTTAENHGDILIKGDYTANATTDIYVGGVLVQESGETADLANLALTNATNYGNIEVAAKVTGNDGSSNSCTIGGIAHHTEGPVTTVANYGDIIFSGVATRNLFVGGAFNISDGAIDGAINEGNITFSGTCGGNIYLGGVVYKTNANATNLTHGALGADGKKDTTKGKISFMGSFTAERIAGGAGTLYGGGIACAAAAITYTNCFNYGDFYVEGPGDVTVQSVYNCFVGGFAYDGGVNATINNCHNYGDFITSEKMNIKNSYRCGGLFGKCESAKTLKFNGCSNSGNFDIKGVTGKGAMQFGGISGSLTSTHKIEITNGFTNNGNITFGSTNGTGIPRLGGIIGCLSSTTNDTSKWSGDIVNTGTITFAGSTDSDVRIGGIAGEVTSVALNASLVNIGDVVVTGTYSGTCCAGGIVGTTAKAVTGAKAYCEIKAIGATNVGMITGAARSETVIASNCQLGGKIATTESEKKTWDDDTEDYIVSVSPDWTELNGNNYFDYIYGSVSWDGVENYDSCTWWSGPTE